jgi:alcohol dehydrogenase class IV
LTSKYGIAHGHAVALLIPMFFSENLNSTLQLNDQRGSDYVEQIMNELFEMMGCATADKCSMKWWSYMKMVGLETELCKLGIGTEDDVNYIAMSANYERLKNHPVVLTKEHIFGLLRNAIS